MQQLQAPPPTFAPTSCHCHLPVSCRKRRVNRLNRFSARIARPGQPLRVPLVVTAAQGGLPNGDPNAPSSLAAACGVAWKVLLLAPAVALAASSCNQAYANSQIHTQVSSSVASVNRFAATSVGNAIPTATAALSTACSSPVLRVTGLVSSLAVAGAMAMKQKKRRGSMVTQATQDDSMTGSGEEDAVSEGKSGKGISEPGVIALGLAALMVESFSPTKPNVSADNVVEAMPSDEETESDSATSPSRRAVKDFLASAGDSEVSKEKKYDPIRSMLLSGVEAGGSAVKEFLKSIEYKGDGRYDLLQDLFTRMREGGIATDSKYDPVCALLDMPVPSSTSKWDPIQGARKLVRAPRRFVTNKFDIFVSFFKGKWQSDNQTLDNLPEWDPVYALHENAGKPVTRPANKYNAVEELLKSDIPNKDIPEWDPVFGFLKGMNAKDASVRSKYDPATMALTGSWQEADMSLNGIPKWDPVWGVQKAAREPVNFESNRYDIAEVFLRGAWQKSLGGLSNLRKWDPVSGFVNLAKGTATYAIPKFDILSVILQGKEDEKDRSEGAVGSRKEAAGSQKKAEQNNKVVGLSDEMRADLLSNISALTKEFEAANSDLDVLFP